MKKIKIATLMLLLLMAGPTKAQRLMTLNQSVEEALKNSPQIVRMRLSLIRTRELLNAQRASLRSNFKLNLNPYQYSNNRQYDEFNQQWFTSESTQSNATLSVTQPVIWTDGTITLDNTFGYRDNYSSSSSNSFEGFSNSLRLGINQPLFTYNRTKMTLKELEFDHENAKLNYALEALNVERQITQYFYQIYQKQMELITSREEWGNRKKSFEIISNKVEAGLTAKEEMLQAELDMMSSQSTVQNNEVELENIKDNFKQMLGLSLSEELMVIAEVSVLPVDIDIKMATNFALLNRMEIRQREIDIETGQFQLIKTNATNEFKGNLNVSVGLFGENEKIKGIYDNPNDNEDVRFSLEVPLFDWGEKKARMRAAEASLQTSEYNLQDEQKTIRLNIRKVDRSLKNTLMQIEIARKNEENAELTYEINLEKYRNGDLTSMDINLFQNQLTQKKNALTNALINYKLELLNMKLQTLYDFEMQRSIIDDVMKYEMIQ
ncbi:TolC family protein [Carboxylicivirga sp. M1479]|uniref:TolC family protein n=1 Tax=Carboxylicivirga sp. M1479 TaxID=2594476 RepID=UPI001178596A|nr:TolC family protein [Carboxylicivirga sp. M1479]TRX70426.1 TolC family protein [Carboxylicivirga sp. M1479]